MPNTAPLRTPLLACGLLLLAGGITAHLARPWPEPIDSPEALLQRLQELGLDYEGHRVPHGQPYEPFRNPGFFIKRRGDPRPWEELSGRLLRTPESMPGFVVVFPLGPRTELSEGERRLGSLGLVGDLTEVARIIEALGTGP